MKRGIAYAAAWALVLGLFLSSCGGKEERSEAPPPSEPATVLETAAGLDEEEILLTVDGREVPAWRCLYWLAYTCDQLAQRYREEGVPLDWSAPAADGTLADYAKEQALEDTALYAVAENWAGAYLPRDAGDRTETAPDASALPELGLSREQMAELASVSRQYNALWLLCQAGGSPLSPSAEDLAAYGEEQGALTVDRILVRAGEDRTKAGERAAELFSQLNGAADQAAAFRELAAAGDDTQGPRTCLLGEETLDETLLAAARELEEGQCSGILESPEGYSILRRLPLDTGALTEPWFDSRLERAAREAQLTASEAWESLDAAAFYAAFCQARQGGGAS